MVRSGQCGGGRRLTAGGRRGRHRVDTGTRAGSAPSGSQRQAVYRLLKHHDRAIRAAELLTTSLKMPDVTLSVLEDGGVGWWRFCFEASAEQVSEAGGGRLWSGPVPRC